MPKPTNYAKFFSVYLRQDVPEKHKDEYVMDCPFHDCPNPTNHFYANCDDGRWHCKRCDEQGNARGLITAIHAQYFAVTTQAQYKYLERLRKISTDIFESASWAYNAEEDMWLVPYYNYDPKTKKYSEFLCNLGYFFPSASDPKSQFVIHKASALPSYLYNPGIIAEGQELSSRSIVGEGEWDTLAYYDAHRDSNDLILGKPGAGFPLTYLQTLEESDEVVLCLDNDESGRKQTASAIRTIQTTKKKVFVLDWTLVENPEKDIRDLWIKRKKTMPEDISNAIIPYDNQVTEEQEATEELTAGYVRNADQFPIINSFDKYIDKVKSILYLTEDTILAMAAVKAITTSISIPGEPIWAFLIGPPSSGKTLYIESYGGTNQWFDNMSKMTAKSLVSGWKDETGEEASYIPSLTNKSLFVKDFTTTLMGPPEAQKELFGLLTDVFDGHVKIPYGNNLIKEFHNTYFNLIAGVTDIVHAHSAASIGERFLRIDWLGNNYNRREYTLRALMNFGNSTNDKMSMTEWTLGFVKHLRSLTNVLQIPNMYLMPLVDLAEFIAIVRTKVEEDRHEGILYRPRPELGPRIGKQLIKLFVAAKTVVGSYELAFKIVRKVAFDTCYGFPMDIIRYILENPLATREQIAIDVDIHAQRAYRVLRNLETTGVLSRGTITTTRRNGRPKTHYILNPDILPALQPEKYLNEDRTDSIGRRTVDVGGLIRPTPVRRTPPPRNR